MGKLWVFIVSILVIIEYYMTMDTTVPVTLVWGFKSYHT